MWLAKSIFGCVILTLAGSAAAQSVQLDSHEHGKGALNMAIEGKVVEIELTAPGADIVGFEHPAESADDKEAIERAKARMAGGDALFVFSQEAGCDLERASVELIADDDEHDDDHGHGGESAETDSGHSEGETHTEFFAYYRFGCADPDAITEIQLPYFDAFPNAQALQVQVISRTGTAGFDVERDDSTLQIER